MFAGTQWVSGGVLEGVRAGPVQLPWEEVGEGEQLEERGDLGHPTQSP